MSFTSKFLSLTKFNLFNFPFDVDAFDVISESIVKSTVMKTHPCFFFPLEFYDFGHSYLVSVPFSV